MFFNEDHLRVTKVRTADGISPIMDPSGEKTLKKIVFLPDNKDTRRLLEEQNTRLPTPLKMKIERIPAYKPVPGIVENKNEDTEILTLKNLELEDEVEKLRKQLAEALNGNGQAKEASANGASLEQKETVTSGSKNK